MNVVARSANKNLDGAVCSLLSTVITESQVLKMLVFVVYGRTFDRRHTRRLSIHSVGVYAISQTVMFAICRQQAAGLVVNVFICLSFHPVGFRQSDKPQRASIRQMLTRLGPFFRKAETWSTQTESQWDGKTETLSTQTDCQWDVEKMRNPHASRAIS